MAEPDKPASSPLQTAKDQLNEEKPPLILVAEDDKSVRLVVQQALARQGYAVQSSGTAAGL